MIDSTKRIRKYLGLVVLLLLLLLVLMPVKWKLMLGLLSRRARGKRRRGGKGKCPRWRENHAGWMLLLVLLVKEMRNEMRTVMKQLLSMVKGNGR